MNQIHIYIFLCSFLNLIFFFFFFFYMVLSIWTVDGMLNGTITSVKSGPGSNGNEEACYTL